MGKRILHIGKLGAAATGLAVLCLSGPETLAQNSGEATYKAKCAVCHGADGKGETPAGKNMKAGSFADPEIAKKSDDELAAIIAKGKNKMPAYEKSLKPEQVKDLVGYIRSLAKKS